MGGYLCLYIPEHFGLDITVHISCMTIIWLSNYYSLKQDNEQIKKENEQIKLQQLAKAEQVRTKQEILPHILTHAI